MATQYRSRPARLSVAHLLQIHAFENGHYGTTTIGIIMELLDFPSLPYISNYRGVRLMLPSHVS